MDARHLVALSALATLLLLASCAPDLVAGGCYKYEKIGFHMVDNVEGSDVDDNMDEALKYYHAIKGSSNPFKKSLIKALATFTSMEMRACDTTCDWTCLETLKVNNDNTCGRMHAPPSAQSYDHRPEKIVGEYMLRHAHNCLPIYPSVLEARLSILDPKMVNAVETLCSRVRRSQVDGDMLMSGVTPEQRTRMWLDIQSVDSDSDGQEAFNALMWLTQNDPRGGLVVRNSAIKLAPKQLADLGDMFNKYIVESCDTYVHKLADVFEAAEFDNKMMEQHEWFMPQAAQFYEHWSFYHICKLVVRDRATLLQKMIKYMTEKPFY